MEKERLKLSQPSEVLSEYFQLTEFPKILEPLFATKGFKFKIKGFSMYPTLYKGDDVEVEPAAKEAIERGDLLIFQKEDYLICHRLVEIFERNGETGFRTKGDAGTRSDPPLKWQQILGKVISIERNGKIWEPSRKIQRFSLGDILSLLLMRAVALLSDGLVVLQSLQIFRLFYRLAVKPNLSYAIGVPVVSGFPLKYFRYFPHPSEEEKKYLESIDRGRQYRFLAKKGVGVVGSLELSASQGDSHRWFISHLFVRRRYRGCGIATALLKQGLQLLRGQKARLLEAKTPSQNRSAISFFKRLGFSETQQKETVLFQKELPFSMQILKEEKELEPFFYSLHFSSQPRHASSHRMLGSRKSFIKNAAKQLIFEQTLFEIDSAFQKAGITFIVQKGMALAYLLYPDPATRPMVDIDLYLRKEDVTPASTVLKDLGYRMGSEDFYEEMMTFGGELRFYKESAAVELHWGLEQYERFKGIIKIDEEDLWKRAVSYTISGRKFLTLCPEHQLLALSIHLGLIHRFRGSLKWFLDIDQFVMKFGEDLDWEELFQTARRWGIERVFCQVLLATQKLFNTPLPPLPLKGRPFFMRKTAFQWLLIDRPQDQMRVLFRAFFPSREWLIYRYRLRKRNWLLYRFLHPFLILLGITR